MSVRGLLAVVFGAVIVAMLARAWSVNRALDEIHVRVTAINEKGLRDAEAVARATHLALDLETGVRGYTLTGDPAFREPYDRASRMRDQTLANLAARVVGTAGGAEAAAEFARELRDWDRDVASALLARSPGDSSESRALHLDGKRRMERMRELLERVRGAVALDPPIQLQSLEARRREVTRDYATGTAIYLALLIAGWVVTTRTIERPLAQLASYAERASDTPPPPVRGAREVVELGKALRVMTEKLAERRALLDSTLAGVAEAVAVFDRDQVCIFANDASRELVGFDLVGKDGGTLARLLSAPSEGLPRANTRAAIRRITDARGVTKTLSVNYTLQSDGTLVTSARDVTTESELRERLASLNEELQAQNEELTSQEEEMRAQSDELTARNRALVEASHAKTQFLATMSHELRTPLNAVIGFSEILIDGTYGAVSEKQSTALHHVHDAGRHLLTLIDDLLDLSKVEVGQIALALSSFEISAPITDAVTLVAATAEKKHIQLQVEVPSSLPVRADRARVRQVVLNLISNAIKFTPDHGDVVVTASVRNRKVRVSVRDTGIGIRAEDGGKLFKPFSQLETGDRRRFGGTGLGLSISKHLVELMDGEIGYASEPGAGSTFWFDLPLASAASSGPTARMPTKRPAAPPRVLVVEDSITDATMIETSLAQAGYEVRVVSDAELALQVVSEMRPALAIVDLALPGMSGLALIERLRADPRFASMPIAVLTGRDVDGDERIELESRVQFIARKGIPSRSEFLAEIAAIVPPAEPASGKRLVLIIDDNDVNRSVACAMVEALGYESIGAEDGPTGLSLARERKPAVVLMDIEMPGMSGLEATRLLRSDPVTAKVPVIALTAHAMSGDAERFLAGGCNDYVSKPFGRLALRRALDRAFSNSDG